MVIYSAQFFPTEKNEQDHEKRDWGNDRIWEKVAWEKRKDLHLWERQREVKYPREVSLLLGKKICSSHGSASFSRLKTANEFLSDESVEILLERGVQKADGG